MKQQKWRLGVKVDASALEESIHFTRATISSTVVLIDGISDLARLDRESTLRSIGNEWILS
jgi:hypothetical protein